MQPVMELADLHDVSVIEDACQATGAILDGHRAGAAGHVGVLSFGGSKLMTSGRGGAVMTNHPEISQRIRLFTQRGNEAYHCQKCRPPCCDRNWTDLMSEMLFVGNLLAGYQRSWGSLLLRKAVHYKAAC